MNIQTLDDARAANPDLGFAAYAYEPGGDVVLEIHTPDGQVFTFSAPTETAVLALAFPPDTEPPPADPTPEPISTDIFG